MPAIFDTLALPTDRSARLLLVHPVTRAPLTDEAGEQGWIELYSWESEQAQATASRATTPRASWGETSPPRRNGRIWARCWLG
jgi:hypothetical protein